MTGNRHADKPPARHRGPSRPARRRVGVVVRWLVNVALRIAEWQRGRR